MIGSMAFKPSERAGIEDARDSYPPENGMEKSRAPA